MLTRYMAGAVLARTGDEMSGPALLVTGLAVTGSPLLASSVLAGLTISAAVGGPLLGVLLDRARRPGKVLGWCLAGYAGGLLMVVGGMAGRVPGAVLAGVAVVTGLLGPALTGGWTAQLPLVAGAGRLGRATAFDSMSYNVAGLAGPALVGVIASAGGGVMAALVSVGMLVAALPAAHGLPSPDPRPADGDGGARPAGGEGGSRPAGGDGGVAGWRVVREEVRAGFRAIVSNGTLRRATVASMVSCCGLAMVVVSAPVLGARLSGESGPGALLLAVIAAGGLVANAVLSRTSRWAAGVQAAGTAVLGAGVVVMACAETYWMAVVGAAVAGAGEGPQLTALFAVRHREAPARLRGQVFTTGASLKITSFAIGSAAAGPLAAYDVSLALLAGAALQAAAVAVLVARRRAARDG
ncbi:MFS transporter [Nonomuraea rubra]|uniref:MFS family permease n=1 Tax=Nonomuraea rubra TaxID=46180 RepID=A0A7X0NS71_9ACTN|nr:MFS transporter [Nonomuraea rubra]MBB6548637.1 MFS family permease [Nonomuraea rubra]